MENIFFLAFSVKSHKCKLYSGENSKKLEDEQISNSISKINICKKLLLILIIFCLFVASVIVRLVLKKKQFIPKFQYHLNTTTTNFTLH